MKLFGYTVFSPGRTHGEHHVARMSDEPTREELRQLVGLHIHSSIEHIYIRIENVRCDLFVDDLAREKGYPLNVIATGLYRADWLAKYPATQAAAMPAVHGVAIVFDDSVWSNGE